MKETLLRAENVFLRQMSFIEINIPAQFIYLGKFGFFEECL